MPPGRQLCVLGHGKERGFTRFPRECVVRCWSQNILESKIVGTKSGIPYSLFENKTVILTNASYSLVLQQKSRSSVLALLLLRAHPLRSRFSSPSQEPAFVSDTASRSGFRPICGSSDPFPYSQLVAREAASGQAYPPG